MLIGVPVYICASTYALTNGFLAYILKLVDVGYKF